MNKTVKYMLGENYVKYTSSVFPLNQATTIYIVKALPSMLFFPVKVACVLVALSSVRGWTDGKFKLRSDAVQDLLFLLFC